jgi:hypothetical protein
MKYIKKFDRMNESIDFKGSDLLLSKLDEAYELLREEIKSSEIEYFYEADEMINKYVSNYLSGKLWSDKDLEDWMRKREFGEE